jgi:hypothetical protein
LKILENTTLTIGSSYGASGTDFSFEGADLDFSGSIKGSMNWWGAANVTGEILFNQYGFDSFHSVFRYNI